MEQYRYGSKKRKSLTYFRWLPKALVIVTEVFLAVWDQQIAGYPYFRIEFRIGRKNNKTGTRTANHKRRTSIR